MALPNNVKFAPDISGLLQAFFADRSYSRIGILADDNTRALCYDLVEKSIPRHELLEIDSGEEHKKLETCQEIWTWMTGMPMDRHSLLVNLGGGVIGDMGGFCAALYKRGTDFINIPTTLLAMVDASAGGKLGIDFRHLKNHLGVFKDPTRVLVSPEFLSTLPQAELRSGYAEVIKHCLIRDEQMWRRISSRGLEEQHWPEIIPHSIGIKGEIVAADPTENSLRKILNFGHTIGHAAESHFLPKRGAKLLHGEAIALGMICEAWLSIEKCDLPKETYEQISSYIDSIYPRISFSEDDIEEMAELCLQDKKNKDGKINASLLEAIGDCRWDVPISLEDIQRALRSYLQA